MLYFYDMFSMGVDTVTKTYTQIYHMQQKDINWICQPISS